MNHNFNTFNDVEHLPLRHYNRLVFMTNLQADAGPEVSKEYISLFSDDEKKAMLMLYHYLRKNGVQKTVAFVTRGMEFDEAI